MRQQSTNHSFDELTRGLASGSISRGRALRLMGAALVGGTLTSFGLGGVALADDECKPTGKKCRKNHQCCSGTCGASSGTCCLPDFNRPGGIDFSPCTSDTQCCSGNCLPVFGRGTVCAGRESIICQCQGGSRISTCYSVDCSTTALDQFCNQQCFNDGGSAGPGTHVCVTNGCVPAL